VNRSDAYALLVAELESWNRLGSDALTKRVRTPSPDTLHLPRRSSEILGSGLSGSSDAANRLKKNSDGYVFN
jgi:hypothetical protein